MNRASVNLKLLQQRNGQPALAAAMLLVTYSLKQYAYRARHRLPVAMSFPQLRDDTLIRKVALPQRVRDSLRAAPVDSSAIRDLVQRLLRERAMTFTYRLGGELEIQIVWDRVSRRFFVVVGA